MYSHLVSKLVYRNSSYLSIVAIAAELGPIRVFALTVFTLSFSINKHFKFYLKSEYVKFHLSACDVSILRRTYSI